MACGDTDAQWAPTLGNSVWSGTLGAETFVLTLTTLQHVAAALVGVVPMVGTWAVQGDDLRVFIATGGLSWDMSLDGTCSGAAVVSAAGGAQDAFANVESVSLTRVV